MKSFQEPASTALHQLSLMNNIMEQLNETFCATRSDCQKVKQEMISLRHKIQKQQTQAEAEVRLKISILMEYGKNVFKDAREQNQQSIGLMKEVKMANMRNKNVLDGANERVKRLGRKIEGEE